MAPDSPPPVPAAGFAYDGRSALKAELFAQARSAAASPATLILPAAPALHAASALPETPVRPARSASSLAPKGIFGSFYHESSSTFAARTGCATDFALPAVRADLVGREADFSDCESREDNSGEEDKSYAP